MSTDRIEVSGITIEVVRKDIKNLHVGVYPPSGRVRVATPLHLDDDAVRLAVVTRLGWIRRKQQEYASQERQSQRGMVSGESHYFQGRRYRLDVREAKTDTGVHLTGPDRMQMTVKPGSNRSQRENVLQAWYRTELRALLPSLLQKWEPLVGQQAAEVRIRRMKTKWGSCNSQARRIWLNLELAKKPVATLEYVLVHELVHLHERHHNQRFVELMDQTMPTWRLRRDELNRIPLSHESW